MRKEGKEELTEKARGSGINLKNRRIGSGKRAPREKGNAQQRLAPAIAFRSYAEGSAGRCPHGRNLRRTLAWNEGGILVVEGANYRRKVGNRMMAK